jgi:hypothetical protein
MIVILEHKSNKQNSISPIVYGFLVSHYKVEGFDDLAPLKTI